MKKLLCFLTAFTAFTLPTAEVIACDNPFVIDLKNLDWGDRLVYDKNTGPVLWHTNYDEVQNYLKTAFIYGNGLNINLNDLTLKIYDYSKNEMNDKNWTDFTSYLGYAVFNSNSIAVINETQKLSFINVWKPENKKALNLTTLPDSDLKMAKSSINEANLPALFTKLKSDFQTKNNFSNALMDGLVFNLWVIIPYPIYNHGELTNTIDSYQTLDSAIVDPNIWKDINQLCLWIYIGSSGGNPFDVKSATLTYFKIDLI